ATLLATAALSHLNIRRLYQHERLVEHAHEVLAELQRIHLLMAEAESATRGFAMTTDASLLKPYDAAISAVPDHVTRLARLTRDDRRQRDWLADLQKQIERQFGGMKAIIRTTREDGATAGAALATGADHRAAMGAVRQSVRAM